MNQMIAASYLILLATFFFNSRVSRADIFRNACRKDGLFKAVGRDKKLTAPSMIVISESREKSLASCGKFCTSDSKCMSINYKKDGSDGGENCQLLNVVRTSSRTSLVHTLGWIHYESISQVTPGCRFVSCEAGRKCQDNCTNVDSYSCIDIDECLSQPCMNKGTCENLRNRFYCSCKPFYIQPLCDSNYASIASQTTTYATVSGGHVNYLQSHRPFCPERGYMRGFRLESVGDDMRYQFECIILKSSSICSDSVKYSTASHYGYGDMKNIDRFPVQCDKDGYIRGFHLQEDSTPLYRYQVHCCLVTSELASAASCYVASTPFTDRGDDDLNFLDRHQIWCNTGYALSSFQYENSVNSNELRLNYRCCRIYS